MGNFGPQPYPMKTGDRVDVSFKARGNLKVEKCGIYVAYRPILLATKQSSQFITEIDGGVSAHETSNENSVSKRPKPVG